MVKKISFPRGEKFDELRLRIVAEYEEITEKETELRKKDIFDFLAKKYGYSQGQAIRNIVTAHKKKTAEQ